MSDEGRKSDECQVTRDGFSGFGFQVSGTQCRVTSGERISLPLDTRPATLASLALISRKGAKHVLGEIEGFAKEKNTKYEARWFG